MCDFQMGDCVVHPEWGQGMVCCVWTDGDGQVWLAVLWDAGFKLDVRIQSVQLV